MRNAAIENEHAIVPRLNHRTIARWAAAAFLIALALYCSGYFALGTRTKHATEGQGHQRYTAIEFPSSELAEIYLPFAVIEAAAKGQFVVIWGRTKTHEIGWWCKYLERPKKRTYRLPVNAPADP